MHVPAAQHGHAQQHHRTAVVARMDGRVVKADMVNPIYGGANSLETAIDSRALQRQRLQRGLALVVAVLHLLNQTGAQEPVQDRVNRFSGEGCALGLAVTRLV